MLQADSERLEIREVVSYRPRSDVDFHGLKHRSLYLRVRLKDSEVVVSKDSSQLLDSLDEGGRKLIKNYLLKRRSKRIILSNWFEKYPHLKDLFGQSERLRIHREDCRQLQVNIQHNSLTCYSDSD